jgi:cystathionine beta-lyase
MDRHVSNTEKIVSYLINEPAVNRVYYPGYPSDPGYSLNLTQASKGGAMLSFELAPGYSPEKFLENLNLIMLAESLGGVESLVCHPASMTHASIPADIRKKIGISDGLLRLSVGIEDADDLIDDIKQALEASGR